jgi:uncharacterized membrane protein
MLKNKLTQFWAGIPTGFRLLIITVLVIGIFLRFLNLDRKVYWYDETFTSLRTSGYTEVEVVQNFFNPQVHRIEELQKYQRLNPEKSWLDTIKSLAIEDPQHPPLYYLVARFWAQLFGNSVVAMRSLPAFLSLLIFPCIFWLCLELFESPLTGWIAIALVAISPLQVLYAQEARQYSLWMVTMLLSSIALLRAMRLKTKESWGIYAVTLAASLYTFLFSGLVAFGYTVYVVAMERFRLTKAVIAYLVASLLSLLLFSPWLFVIITHSSKIRKTTAWTNFKKPILQLFEDWINNLSYVFLDIGNSPPSSLIYWVLKNVAIVSLLVLVGYSLYFIYIQTPKGVGLFILTLVGVPMLILMLPNLILYGKQSTIPRYFLPSYLGIQLSVAYLLAAKLTGITATIRQQKLWQRVMIALVSSGIISCIVSAQAELWWHKGSQQTGPVVARIINQASSPFVIGSAKAGDLLALSHILNPKVEFLVAPQCDACDLKPQPIEKAYIPKISKNSSNVYLLSTGSSEEWRHQLEKDRTYKMEPIVPIKPDEILLWRLQKQ